MMEKALLLITALIPFLLGFRKTKKFIMPENQFDHIYKKYAEPGNLDWRLLKAVARVESDENANAKNPLDPSYGLMQVLCKSDGLDSHCKNKLYVNGWDEATPNRLFDPDYNVRIASQILAWNIEHFGLLRGIATYNRWESRNDPINGPFGNQDYVDKVMSKWKALKGDPK